ncbi:choice-of-anchor C family protein [Archangium lipolyticum]|uniref:choice-of-anchor C family protein n=1 Tax=Archangium lipolyticum TaxID=2970465 RepID=UPI00214A426B|nr:choice-of-anchor C family protein [Archangium lipolyticum]
MKDWKKRTPFRAWCGSVLLGALVTACGPVPEGDAPENGSTVEENAVDETSSPEGLAAKGGSGSRGMPTLPRTLATSGPAVGYGGGKYLVVWEDVREGAVYGSRMRPDGTLLDPVGFRINISDEIPGGTPSIAYDGENFVVVWEADGVSGVRVSPDGTVLGPVFNVITSGEVFEPVGIACSRELCLVSFTVTGDDQSLIYLRGVLPDGTVIEEDGEERFHFLGDPRGYAFDSSVAWNGREFLVVWSDSRGGLETPDIYGARVAADGSVTAPLGFPISTAPGAQIDPDVTWTGRRFLTVWEDRRGGGSDIFGARVRRDTRVDDPEGLPIATSSAAESAPAVAHHNSKSLVVWRSLSEGTSSIRGARITEDGESRDPSGFQISSPGRDADFNPDVAYGGSRFLSVYARASSPEERPFLVVGSRVDHDTDVHRETTFTRYFEPSTPNLIQNGSFESGYDGPPELWKTLEVGETIPGGWVVTLGNVDWHDGSSLGASDGRRDVDLSGSTRGALAQTFPTTPGRTYLLTFDLAGNPAIVCGADLKFMAITVGSVFESYTYDTAPYADDFTGLRWRPQAVLFTATGSTTTVTFESGNDSCGGPAIDNVAVRLLPPGY